jgi:hypothetical protein
MLLTQMWLAKCSARKRSGRPVESINSLGSRVDEFVTKTAVGGANASMRAKTSRFSSRLSGTASITRSAPCTADAS